MIELFNPLHCCYIIIVQLLYSRFIGFSFAYATHKTRRRTRLRSVCCYLQPFHTYVKIAKTAKPSKRSWFREGIPIIIFSPAFVKDAYYIHVQRTEDVLFTAASDRPLKTLKKIKINKLISLCKRPYWGSPTP